MKQYEIEVCVEDLRSLALCADLPLSRIELCSALAIGGVTPGAGLMARAACLTLTPIYAMIRPRAGSFVFEPAEIELMEADIHAARSAGMAGVVLGAITPDHALDIEVLGRLTMTAQGMGLTLHRAIDLVADVETAVEQAIDLGFDRILSSGGAVNAIDGIERLQRMVDVAAGRIDIMAGAGVAADHVPELAAIGIRCFHGSCSGGEPELSAVESTLFGSASHKRTDRTKAETLIRAVEQVD